MSLSKRTEQTATCFTVIQKNSHYCDEFPGALQISKIKNFVKISWCLKAVSCCCKTYHLRFFLKDLVTPLKCQYYSISCH